MSKKDDVKVSDMDIFIRGVWYVNNICRLYRGVKMGFKFVVKRRELMGKEKKRGGGGKDGEGLREMVEEEEKNNDNFEE